jgi:YD repeat-containing protein
MSIYQFLTKREKRKTPWRISKWTIRKRIEYLYNSNVNLTSLVNFNDIRLINNKYNMFGQVIKTVTDGRTVEYEYDDLGWQTATIDHPTTIDGQTVQHRSETIYDEYGRVAISRMNVKQFADGTIDRSEAQELKYVYDALRE